jgi:hypothetical protein
VRVRITIKRVGNIVTGRLEPEKGSEEILQYDGMEGTIIQRATGLEFDVSDSDSATISVDSD